MKQAVARTRTGLQERMEDLLSLARPVDESALEELEGTLIASDIGVITSQEIIDALRQQASRQQIRDGAELRHLLKAEMLRILDSVPARQHTISAKPEVILMVGVNGTGKTTTTGKLAAYFRNQGKSVLLCAADTFRAAAIEQLEVWSQRAGVEMIRTRQGGDPSAALYDALQAGQTRGIDVLIVDTAGRLHTKNNLMAELDKIRRTAQRFLPGCAPRNLAGHGCDHRSKWPATGSPVYRRGPGFRHCAHQAGWHRKGWNRDRHCAGIAAPRALRGHRRANGRLDPLRQ